MVGSQKTFYWEKNPSGKNSLILLHGFPGGHGGFLKIASKFSDFHIIIPDLPGCGKSSPLRKRHNLENYTQWLDDFMKAIDLSRAIIIGHSFGSRVAIFLADHYPERTQKLVLVCPVVSADNIISKLVLLEYKFAAFLPTCLQKKFIFNRIYLFIKNNILFKSVTKKQKAEFIRGQKREIDGLDNKANLEVFNDLYGKSAILQGKQIDIPVLVVVGRQDEIATVRSAEELCKRFSNYQMDLVSNAGHFLPIEKPLTLASIIMAYLSQ